MREFHLFKQDHRWYIQHCINRYWKFSYINKSIAEQVHANLQQTFKENNIYTQVKYLVRQFVERIELVEFCPKELDK